MNRFVYTTINNDGILKSSGPHRLTVTSPQCANQSFGKFIPTTIKHEIIKGEKQTLKQTP